MSNPKLFLASTSQYRKALLDGYKIASNAIAPSVDESIVVDESPEERSARLGLAKARSVADQLDPGDAWLVLGSDQVCHMHGQIYRKPGSREAAGQHLRQFSGNWVTFSTSLVLLANHGKSFETVEHHRLQYRNLSDQAIEEYLDLDKPFDCTGAIKVESFGLSLLSNSEGRDVNSVYGVPILALFEGLRALGLAPDSFK